MVTEMDMAVIFLTVCFIATVIGSVVGIGGGMLMKPILEAASGYGVDAAGFLSGCAVLAMAAVTLLCRPNSRKDFEPRRGSALVTGAALGGVLGKLLFDLALAGMGNRRLGILQAIGLCLLSAVLLANLALHYKIRPRHLQSLAACLLLGLAVGAASGLLGIDGGALNLLLLSLALSMDKREGAVHSIWMILAAQAGSLGTTLLRSNGPPECSPVLLACALVGGMLGGLAGNITRKNLDGRAIEILYGAALAFVFLISGWNLMGFFGVTS